MSNIDLVKQLPLNLIDASQYFFDYRLETNKQPRPQSNFKKLLWHLMILRKFFLDLIRRCQAMEINLYNAVNFP